MTGEDQRQPLISTEGDSDLVKKARKRQQIQTQGRKWDILWLEKQGEMTGVQERVANVDPPPS